MPLQPSSSKTTNRRKERGGKPPRPTTSRLSLWLESSNLWLSREALNRISQINNLRRVGSVGTGRYALMNIKTGIPASRHSSAMRSPRGGLESLCRSTPGVRGVVKPVQLNKRGKIMISEYLRMSRRDNSLARVACPSINYYAAVLQAVKRQFYYIRE